MQYLSHLLGKAPFQLNDQFLQKTEDVLEGLGYGSLAISSIVLWGALYCSKVCNHETLIQWGAPGIPLACQNNPKLSLVVNLGLPIVAIAAGNKASDAFEKVFCGRIQADIYQKERLAQAKQLASYLIKFLLNSATNAGI